jgi:hypothetical protein
MATPNPARCRGETEYDYAYAAQKVLARELQ